MASTNTSSSAARLAWAAEQLNADQESSPQEFTIALLRRVDEEDFVPPPALREAWEIATDRSTETPPEVNAEFEEELHGQIENFATKFFDLSPADRNRTWDQLASAAQPFPKLATRLEALRPGLNVVFPTKRPLKPLVSPLLAIVRELFVLPPDRRALRRCELLRESLQPLWKAVAAARYVRRRYRAIAAISPDLVQMLARRPGLCKQAMQNERLRHGQPARSTIAPAASHWVVICVVVGVVVGLATIFVKPDQGPRPPSSLPPIFYGRPYVPPQPPLSAPLTEQERALDRYLEKEGMGENTPNPEQVRERFIKSLRTGNSSGISLPPDSVPVSPTTPSQNPTSAFPPTPSPKPTKLPPAPVGPHSSEYDAYLGAKIAARWIEMRNRLGRPLTPDEAGEILKREGISAEPSGPTSSDATQVRSTENAATNSNAAPLPASQKSRTSATLSRAINPDESPASTPAAPQAANPPDDSR